MAPTDTPAPDRTDFRAILNATGAAIFSTDLAGIVRTFNPAAERLLGWRAAEIVGEPAPMLWHGAGEVAARAVELSNELGPTVSPGFEAFVAKLQGGLDEQREWTFVRKDGLRFPAISTVSAVQDERGQTTGFVVAAQDLTARLQAEQERDRFFNLSLDMFCIVGTDGYFKCTNPAFSQALGWSDEELLSRPFLEFVHPEDRAATLAEMQKLAIGRPTRQFANRYRRQDGSWRSLAWMANVQPDGLLLCVARDLTELKQAEKALRQSQQDLAITLESIGDAVLVTDAARRVTRLNPVAEKLTGWTRAEAIGRPAEEVFRIVNEETRLPATIPIDEVLTTGAIHGLANHTALIARDGSECSIADSAAPMRNEDGRITGVVLVFRDVREERKAEREIQRLNSDLERRVQERTAALRQSEQRYRLLVEQSPDGIFIGDAQGRYLDINPAGTEMLGYTRDELLGLNISDVVEADEIPRIQPEIARFASGQVVRSEWRFRRKDGSTFPGEVVGRQLADGRLQAIVRDIADRKQAEAALRASEAKYRQVVENGRDVAYAGAVGEVYLESPLIFVSAQAFRVLGYTPKQILADPGIWLASVHPDDRDLVDAATLQALADGLPRRRVYRFKHRQTAEYRWLEDDFSPYADKSGRVVAFFGLARDITERHRTEEALRTLSTGLIGVPRERLFERIAQKLGETLDVPIAFVCVPLDKGRTRFKTLAIVVDGQALPNFEYAADNNPCKEVRVGAPHLVPCDAWKLYPDDRMLVELRIEAYAAVAVVDLQGNHQAHLGVMSRQPIASMNEVESILNLFATRVSEEMTRQASERRFSDLFEFSPDAIVLTDAEGIVVEANRQVEQVFGWSREELVGRPVEALMPPNMQAGHVALRERYLRSAVPRAMGSGRSNLLGMRKDGSVFPVDIGLSPLGSNDGPLIAAAVRDVTERQQVMVELQMTAEELQAANETIEADRNRLAHRVAERTAELSSANAELAKASHAKSEFLATMSHELRTPLNGILGMNELLSATELTDVQRRYVDAASASGKALAQLVNDILDLSKIEAGKLEFDERPCDLEALVYEVIESFTHSARSKNLALTCHLADEVCVTVLCDDNRLRQVLVNLVGNAIKFTSMGSVALRGHRVTWPNGQVGAHFSVVDTGIGIPIERRDRLFEAFSQVDSSTTRRFGGTGLGLSICKKLVEAMGGEIGVDSQIGTGSTFWFRIPTTLVSEGMEEERRRTLAGIRVLAVDGLDRERRQIAECLNAWGCPFEQVETIAQAQHAIARAQAAGTPFAIVLADCRVAQGDEYVRLQKLAVTPDLRVICVGVPLDERSTDYLKSLGVRQVLRDPVRPSALFDALASVMSVTRTTAAPESGRSAGPRGSPRSISGHVLVAEDNRMNQIYAVELLKQFGCTCDVVANGEEALDAVQRQRYDLVLMDCQMPEMDGFTATREIRRREAGRQSAERLPIVALTANAMRGDRERCLDAGMDDYLSKPVEPGTLRTVLERFLGQPGDPPSASDWSV